MVTKPKTDSQLAKQYQKKTDKEHILDNPDTYTGSMEQVSTELHVLESDSKVDFQRNSLHSWVVQAFR